MPLKSVFFLSVSLYFACPCAAATDKVVCFYQSWSVYREDVGKFLPEYVDPSLCTHIIYAFLGVDTEGNLKILNEDSDITLGGLSKIAGLRQKNPDLRVLISIGGWSAGSLFLSGIAACKFCRDNLVTSALGFFDRWKFNGLDIYWEYPREGDKENYVQLLNYLRSGFDNDTSNEYLLSVTVPANVLPSYNVPEISNAVDLINVRTFDFHFPGDGSGRMGHNAPLYSDDELNVNSSINNWISSGANASKLILGISFGGHSYSLFNETLNEPDAPAITGIAGIYTLTPGSLGFNEICSIYGDWDQYWDEKGQVPYAQDYFDWISYDNGTSVSKKVELAKQKGLGGIMVWSIDTDDFYGRCYDTQNYELLYAVNANLSNDTDSYS